MRLNLQAENLRELFCLSETRTKILDMYWQETSKNMVDHVYKTGAIDQNEYIDKMIAPCTNEYERALAIYHAGRVVSKIIEENQDDCNCPICQLERMLTKSNDGGENKKQNTSDSTDAPNKTAAENIRIKRGVKKVSEIFCIPDERKIYIENQITDTLKKLIPVIKMPGKGYVAESVDLFSQIGENAQERAYALWVCGYKCCEAKMINVNPFFAALLLKPDSAI